LAGPFSSSVTEHAVICSHEMHYPTDASPLSFAAGSEEYARKRLCFVSDFASLYVATPHVKVGSLYHRVARQWFVLLIVGTTALVSPEPEFPRHGSRADRRAIR
jgi:hypothetical protein